MGGRKEFSQAAEEGTSREMKGHLLRPPPPPAVLRIFNFKDYNGQIVKQRCCAKKEARPVKKGSLYVLKRGFGYLVLARFMPPPLLYPFFPPAAPTNPFAAWRRLKGYYGIMGTSSSPTFPLLVRCTTTSIYRSEPSERRRSGLSEGRGKKPVSKIN